MKLMKILCPLFLLFLATGGQAQRTAPAQPAAPVQPAHPVTGNHDPVNKLDFFRDLEQRWAAAIQRKDQRQLDEVFLSDDYALRISDDPARKISRSVWLATLAVYNTRSFAIRDLEIRDFGDVVIVSEVLNQQADVHGVDRSGDFFIVDTWTRHGDVWKVSARYSSPSKSLPPMPMGSDGHAEHKN